MEEALQITQLITNIVIILLFIGLLLMVFGLIRQSKKIMEKISLVSGDLKDLKPKVSDTIDKVNYLMENLTSVVVKVNENVEVLGTVVEKVKDTADGIIEFEQKIQKSIEPPVMDALNTVNAVSVGVRTFFDKWKENKSLKSDGSSYSNETADERISDLEESVVELSGEINDVNSKLTDLKK